jgi:hypothetical protein
MTHITTKQTEKGEPMEKIPFILHEKFRSDNNEQRKEHFQKKFERYIVDRLSAADSSKTCD